jgi:phage repressor protein C with HTH and peptisase S24 domain
MFPTLYANPPKMFLVSDTNETYGDRLRKIRERLGLSARKAASLSDPRVTHSNIGKIESGQTPWENVQLNTIKGLARAYGLSVSELLNEVNGTPYPAKPNVFTDQVHLEGDLAVGTIDIPEYDMLSAGPGGHGGEIIGYIPFRPKTPGEYVGYRISGDSMSPRIGDGDTVVIKVRDYASAGNIIVCWTPDEGMMCKYLKEIKPDGTYVLTSYNPEYPPIWTKDIKIYGLVIQRLESIPTVSGNY